MNELKHDHGKPLLGILVKKKFIHSRIIHPFAIKISEARECVGGTVFFFSAENINWKKRKIDGYVLSGSRKRWQVCEFPFPDIIYDRAACMPHKEEAAVKELRFRLKKRKHLQFINSCKLKKWEVYKRLFKHQAVRHFLPATVYSKGIDDIKNMLSSYNYIFLKSSGGSGGKGVFAVKKNSPGYCYYYYHHGVHLKRYATTLDSLSAEMNTINIQPDKVIIQQGIDLIRYHNRTFDLRILMVKDWQGSWNAVYIQARIAPEGALITNVSLGGKVKNYGDLLPKLKKRYHSLPAENTIKHACMVIAFYIEKEFGPFGEIGIDLGVDKNGKLWLLEANSKPSKLPEKHIEDTAGVSPQFRMILEYANYLYQLKMAANQNQ